MTTDESFEAECIEHDRLQAAQVHAQQQALDRANVFYLLCAEYITDEQATQALKQIEQRQNLFS